MPWRYEQTTGRFADPRGREIGVGYSGYGIGRNNFLKQTVRQVGPLPLGRYKIGAYYKHPKLGPLCMNLDPFPETETFGRTLFRIHGNNKTNDASHGCVILGPGIRGLVAASEDRIFDCVRQL